MSTFLSFGNNQLKVYNNIYNAISHGKTEITLNNFDNINSILDIIKIVLGENSEYFFYDNCNVQYSKNGVLGTKIYLQRWVRGYKLVKMIDDFRTCASEIINSVISDKMNDIQKALSIHNYLINNVKYIETNFNETSYPKLHTAYGAIVEKRAVCEGISAAYCYLLNLVGVSATIVNGITTSRIIGNHSWNMIKINDDFYHVDVTWDLKNNTSYNYNSLDYFAITDNNLSNRKWNKAIYPSCTSERMNFFYLTQSIAQTEEEFTKIAIRQIKTNNAIYIKFKRINAFQNENDAGNYIFKLIKNNKNLYANMEGELTLTVNLDQSTVYIRRT